MIRGMEPATRAPTDLEITPDVQRTTDVHPTREALIAAGERLFAERGLHGVSLREIGLAAGQRNNNVTQYHFGSKEGLVTAIFEHRSAAVNERRLQLLEGSTASAGTDIRTLIAAFFLPLAEQIESGNSYVAFLARLRTDGQYEILRNAPNREVVSAHDRIADTLRHGPLAGMPRRLFWNRWALTIDMGMSALANFRPTMLTLDEFVSELVDGLAAFLAAPSRSITTDVAKEVTR
jgi:AcrR family transcriptional regulator